MRVVEQALKRLVYMSAITSMDTYFRSTARHGGDRYPLHRESRTVVQSLTTKNQQREVGIRLACPAWEQDGGETR